MGFAGKCKVATRAAAVFGLVVLTVPPATAKAASKPQPGGASTTLAGAGGANPSISADGGRVAFSTTHALVANDTNGAADLYVRDRASGSVRRVSVSSTGGQGSGVRGPYGSINGYSPRQLSEDGNVTVFVTEDSSLVPPRDVVSTVLQVDVDVFVHDLRSGRTREVLVDRGTAAAAIVATVSGDGSTVAWETYAGRIWVQKLATGETVEVGRAGGSAPDGYVAAPSLSRDGSYVAFVSNAPNLSGGSSAAQVHVADLTSGATTMVSRGPTGEAGNGYSYTAALSGDGSVVAFYSAATNLTTPPPTPTWHVYAHRVPTGVTTIVSSGVTGSGNRSSFLPSISSNGRFVSFSSDADNLVARDTNNANDVFVHDLQAGTLIRASVTSSGGNADGDSYLSAVSEDGRTVAFESRATNLAPAPTATRNLFLRAS